MVFDDDEVVEPEPTVLDSSDPFLSKSLTLLSCRSLTESKQIGHRAHLFSEVLR